MLERSYQKKKKNAGDVPKNTRTAWNNTQKKKFVGGISVDPLEELPKDLQEELLETFLEQMLEELVKKIVERFSGRTSERISGRHNEGPSRRIPEGASEKCSAELLKIQPL